MIDNSKEYILCAAVRRKERKECPRGGKPYKDGIIATLFRNFDDVIIDLQMLVNVFKYKKVSSQYLFHSAKAIKYLHRL